MPVDQVVQLEPTGITCQCPEDSKADLRSEFHNLTTLLALVTAINNKGLSTLRQDYVESYRDNTTFHMAPVSATINALAQILVRDYRAVAVALPNSSLYQSAPSVLTSTGTGLQVYAIQDEEIRVFAPITNTDTSQHPQASDYMIITKGTSHFKLISNKHWECLRLPKNDSLEHHVATIEDYIKRYNAIDSEDKFAQTDLFHTFTRYLIASCWKKMYTRAVHWSSLGFLYILGSLDEGRVRLAFKASLVKTTERKDSALATMLQQKSLLTRVSMEYRTPSGHAGEPPTFAHLASASEEVNMSAGLIYNEHTSFEFHQLLVATLLGYRAALEEFAKAMNRPDDSESGMRMRKTLAEEFLRFSRLLWRIAYSQILTQHLEVLAVGSLLHLPSDHERKEYESYAGFTSPLVPPPAKMAGTAGEEGPRTGEGNDMVARDEKVEKLLVDEDEMGNELQRMRMDLARHTNTITGRAKTFRTWIRHIVSHWGALDVISAFSNSQTGNLENIDISVMSVKPFISRGSSMADWKDTVRTLASHTADTPGTWSKPFDADAAIKILESQIESGDADFHDSFVSVGSTMQEKSKTMQSSPQAKTRIIHSEAAAALFTKDGYDTLGHGTPSELVKPLLIGVSQLSCPVCSDLLTYLRTGGKLDFSSLGRHSSLSPVELPPWLPRTILEKMVARYKDHMRIQISDMLAYHSPTLRHRHNPSPRIEIVTSRESGSQAGSELKEEWR